MAQRDQVLGMFGASPEQIMARIRREQAQEVLRTQDPFQRAGGAIGMGLARMFGGEPAEVTRQRQLQQTLQGVNMEDPEQMTQAARVLNQSGFSNEAMQLLSRADQFRTSAMDRERSQASIDLAGQQVEASKAEVARGLFERVDETISQPVTIDGQTYYVPVQAKVKYNKETGAREVLTSTSELEQMGQQAAQKMKREDLAAQSEATLRETQLTAAKKQATLADAQLTATQKKAGETTGLVRVPIQRDEFDPLTQRTKKVTGYEYKATTGTMTTDENGNEIFVPNMQLPPEAEVVDDKGLPQGAIEIERGRETTITNSSGQEFVKVGAGEEAKFYQVITEGDSVYYMPTPVDPGSILKQPAEEEQASTTESQQSTVGTRIDNRITQKPNPTGADRTVGLIKQVTGQ
jgi:hypothetical protein